MKLPNIDLASLPGLDTATGIFGSTAHTALAYDDRVVAIMVYVYDVVPTSAVV